MKHVPFLKLLSGTALALALIGSPAIARDRHGDQGSKETKQALYPNATRKEPKLDLKSEKEQKKLNEGLEAVNAGDKDKAMQLLQPLAQDADSKYAQSLALQGIANLKYNDGDLKGAIASLKQALDIGVLPNDTFFQLEYELAQFYLADEQYQPAIDTVEKWRAEGKRETPESYALEGNAYYRLEKYPEAITALKKAMSMTDKPETSWTQVLMASYSESGQADQAAQLAQQQLASNPNDATAMNNAVAVLMQAQKYPEAIDLMEKARASGSLKDEKQYVNLAKLYLITGQNSDDPKPNAKKAEAVLEDGMAKGVVASSYDNQKLLGDAAYIAGDESKAIAAYKKAMPMAKDGEAALRAGQLLLGQQKYSDARTLIKQAIAKGVQHKGTAYMLLADAERGLKNKPGAIAAMKQAAQDPDTAAKAKAWLKQAGAGK
ncbi:tetratricopeptide repeat protein [Frateuria sp. MAH-13]|uniref:Tetratricopeptide repeat protein n=1 Tax=Frateuria flava TaxID=2821489 RepID=A0ABS4DPF9_9GAMM|nr:tetratricopeptide repeat protein [Frateuria flava]MBP1474932.1 tetratricopeptide repeat protein [Frateuria flava]